MPAERRLADLESSLAQVKLDPAQIVPLVAPLLDMAELCERYGSRLMVDEAHSAGVLGARGAGACELLGVEDRVDLRGV